MDLERTIDPGIPAWHRRNIFTTGNDHGLIARGRGFGMHVPSEPVLHEAMSLPLLS